MQPVVERFKQTYGRLNAQSLGLLSELYEQLPLIGMAIRIIKGRV